MKTTFLTRCVVLLLSCLMLLSSCGGGGGSTETTEPITEPPVTTEPPPAIDLPSDQELSVLSNGKSDYVIVYDETDTVSKTVGTKLQKLIEKNFGVILKLRSHSSSYEKEIIVGKTTRESSQTVYHALDEAGDFAIWLAEDDLVIAINARILLADLYLRLEELFAPATEGDKSLKLTKEDNYHYRRDPAIAESSGVDLVKNGKSNFVIVYDPEAEGMRALASSLSRAIRSMTNVYIASQADAQSSKKDYEILLGASVDRTETQSMNALLGKEDFAVALIGKRLVITGTDNVMLVQAVLKFLENGTADGIRFDLSDSYVRSEHPNDTCDGEAFVALYQEAFHSYGSYIEEMVDRSFSESEKADIALVSALVTRMDRTAAFYVGSGVALYNGKKHKLDPEACLLVARKEGGDLLIPKAFAEVYFGTSVSADGNGYVNISQLCRSDDRYQLYFDTATGLAIVSPKDVPSFEGNESDGRYTNSEYRARMIAFFTSFDFPEPKNSAEATRKTVYSVPYEGPFYDWTKVSYQTLSSPSILTREENGKQVIYVSHEVCTWLNWDEPSTTTYLKRSEDDGETWETVGTVENMRWATVFEHRGELYLLGNLNTDNNRALLAHRKADGSMETVFVADNCGAGNPCPVLVTDDRLYKAYNGRVISIDVNADLTNPQSWVTSDMTFASLLTDDWLRQAGIVSENFYHEEINLVVGPDGDLWAIMRTNNIGVNKAIVLKVSKDGKTISYPEGHHGLITMPTTRSRFTCRYDEKTKQYIALTSVPNTVDFDMNRTVLAIVTSKDLVNWQIKDYLVVERDLLNAKYAAYAHGFQYADFVIDGDDLLFVVREAREEVNMWHDGNYISYYRLADYADVIS